MDKILSDKMGHDMEALVWETAEELDKKLTKLAMVLELAEELRDLFTQVPYRNIQEVINASKGKS